MWQVIGQTKTVVLLDRALKSRSLAHAYLFVGPSHVGKMTLALELARALNCTAKEPPCGKCLACKKVANHPDVQVIGLGQPSDESKSRAEIGIEQIRQMQHSASLPPFEGKYKVFIIDGAEALSMEAANCLLKTLEEPAGHVVFILLVTNDSLLLPTVISRCQRLELRPLPAGEIEKALGERGVEAERARLLSRLAHGGIGWALSASPGDSILDEHAEKVDKILEIMDGDSEERFAYAAQMATRFGQDRGAVYETLGLWVELWHDLLLAGIGCPETIVNVDRTAALVEMAKRYPLPRIKRFIDSILAAGAELKLNANPRLVLEVLMLDMPVKEIGEASLARE
ncbi:MAG: DNA polymerase III subunit [Dehalococcoidales bacterium]|nr:DNA polymerase III subunit [Dehalococcoidales bacterium]